MGTSDDAARPAGLRTSTRYFPAVEGLRGVATLLVLAHHAWGGLNPTAISQHVSVSLPMAFVAGGQTGVSLFFVLSAFCLCRPLFTRPGGAQAFELRAFYQRRLLRILPLYWAVLAAGVVTTSTSMGDAARFAPWFFFLQALPAFAPPVDPFTGVMWSLATEMQFYLLLPLLPLAMRSPAWRPVAARVLGILAALYALFLAERFPGLSLIAEPGFDNRLVAIQAIGHSLVGRSPHFAAGILLALAWQRRGDAVRQRLGAIPWLRRGGADVALLATLVALAALLQWQVEVGYWKLQYGIRFAWLVPEALLWATVLALFLAAPLQAGRLLTSRPMLALGAWSYSIYLWHLPVQHYLYPWLLEALPGTVGSVAAAAMALTSIAAVGLSALSYRWIETPFLLRKARIAS